MAILVQEASDTDIPRACEMEAAAYANNAASPILFPGPFPPDHLEQRGNGLIADRKADPTIRSVTLLRAEKGILLNILLMA